MLNSTQLGEGVMELVLTDTVDTQNKTTQTSSELLEWMETEQYPNGKRFIT